MAFVQIIEFTTTRSEEMAAVMNEFRESSDGTRVSARGMVCVDRDKPNSFVTVVEFPSYEEAMENSERPETSAMAAKLAELCDGPPTFRNLDVVDVIEG